VPGRPGQLWRRERSDRFCLAVGRFGRRRRGPWFRRFSGTALGRRRAHSSRSPAVRLDRAFRAWEGTELAMARALFRRDSRCLRSERPDRRLCSQAVALPASLLSAATPWRSKGFERGPVKVGWRRAGSSGSDVLLSRHRETPVRR
jgi:hypothetical protein